MPHKNITFKYLKCPIIKASIKALINASIKASVKCFIKAPINVYYMCLI